MESSSVKNKNQNTPEEYLWGLNKVTQAMCQLSAQLLVGAQIVLLPPNCDPTRAQNALSQLSQHAPNP